MELQAPQGPYTNALDLQVFPAMSKKHSELLQMFNNTEANTDRIWKIAMEIWRGISSSMIARSFILAYRIMRKIPRVMGIPTGLKTGPRIAMSDGIIMIQIGVLRKYQTL